MMRRCKALLALGLSALAQACFNHLEHAAGRGRRQRRTIFLGLLLALAQAVGAAPIAWAAKPNIVLILTDDQDHLSLWSMRHVNELIAKQGVSFNRAYVSVSGCCPSRATILTGKYPQNTGVLTNNPPRGGFAAFRQNGNESSTIATWLNSAGYRTGLFGKYLNLYPDPLPASHAPPGWTKWVAATTKGASLYEQYNYVLSENGTPVRYGSSPSDYGTDVLARKAVNFVMNSAAAGKPFLLYFAPTAPHSPEVAAPRHAELFNEAKLPRNIVFPEADTSDKPPFLRHRPTSAADMAKLDHHYRRRLRSLQAVDEAVKAIHDALVASGQLANTYFVFTSDNGYRLGQHNLSRGKKLAYEEMVRVPLLVRGPGIPQGVKLGHLVVNADLAPTFASWAGVAAPGGIDGRSLAPLLGAEPPSPLAWRQAIPLAYYREAQDVFPEFRGVRTLKYSYIEWATGDRELYDTHQDPLQEANRYLKLKGTNPALVELLSARTKALNGCRADACRSEEDKPF